MMIFDRDISKKLIEDKAVARILDVEITNEKAKSFAVTIELLSGPNAGALMCDEKFNATADGKYFWRWQQLSKAVKEDNKKIDIVDIDRCLYNKNVKVFLSIFRTENRFGQKLEFQNFNYIECSYTNDQINEFIKQTEEKVKADKANMIHEMVRKIRRDTNDSPFIENNNIFQQPKKV